MPGPVSDSYDPEWGTGANVEAIERALRGVHGAVAEILGQAPPIFVLDLVRTELPTPITTTLTEWQWRMIRFALERAVDTI